MFLRRDRTPFVNAMSGIGIPTAFWPQGRDLARIPSPNRLPLILGLLRAGSKVSGQASCVGPVTPWSRHRRPDMWRKSHSSFAGELGLGPLMLKRLRRRDSRTVF